MNNNQITYKRLISKACYKQHCDMSYLASLIGASTASIYRWYNGEAKMSADAFLALISLSGSKIEID